MQEQINSGKMKNIPYRENVFENVVYKMLAISCRPRWGNTNKVDSIQPSTDFWQSAIQEWRGKAKPFYNTLGPGKMAPI